MNWDTGLSCNNRLFILIEWHNQFVASQMFLWSEIEGVPEENKD